MEEKTVNEITGEEQKNNGDTAGTQTSGEEKISFRIEDKPAPERGWTVKQKRAVIIIAVIVTIIVAVIGFFLQSIDFDYFSFFA